MVRQIGLINAMKAAVTIPVIASSGAGSAQHFVECFEKTPVEVRISSVLWLFLRRFYGCFTTVLRLIRFYFDLF